MYQYHFSKINIPVFIANSYVYASPDRMTFNNKLMLLPLIAARLSAMSFAFDLPTGKIT